MTWSQSDLIAIMDLSPKKHGIKYGVQQARRFIAEREKEKVEILIDSDFIISIKKTPCSVYCKT